jgi:polysaccharide biosynthesis/export protein
MITKSFAVVGCIVLGSICPSAVGQDQFPSELVKYIVTARKANVNDRQIEANATEAGWPLAQVTEALAYVSRVPNAANEPVKKAEVAELPRITSDVSPIGRPPAVLPPATPPQQSTPDRESRPAISSPAIPNPPAATNSPQVAAVPSTDISPSHGVPDDYQIGAGDVLTISVWKEPEASIPSVVVRPDGKISMPLLKEVSVAGLTPAETEKLITERLSKTIKVPDVTVVVTGIHSKKIYVVGAVKKEGPIAYTYRMSVMQAISEAGGLNDYAKRKKIYVLRNEGGRDYRLPFDYDAVLKGERMELNLQLVPGDTLVVPH